MAETTEHLELKSAAEQWARLQGYRAVGLEVRVPNSNFRADVAACMMERPAPGEVVISRTAVFECKQSRADFLNDNFPEQGSKEELAQLHNRRQKLEELVGGHYPNLRTGDSLFPEFRDVDPSRIGHQGYRRVVRDILRIERGIFRRTKFDRLVRYRCADVCYLVALPGIVEPDEVPLAWGILERDPDVALGDPEIPLFSLVRTPSWNDSPENRRLELLFNIASKKNHQSA